MLNRVWPHRHLLDCASRALHTHTHTPAGSPQFQSKFFWSSMKWEISSWWECGEVVKLATWQHLTRLYKIFRTWLTFFSNSGPFVIACIMASDSLPSRFLMTDSMPSLLRTIVIRRSMASENEVQSVSRPPRNWVRQPLLCQKQKTSLIFVIREKPPARQKLTSRHWSSNRSTAENDGNYVPCMKHNNSSGEVRADTWCLAYRWAGFPCRPQSLRHDRAISEAHWHRWRSAEAFGWYFGGCRRRAEACRRTSRGSSCSRYGNLLPLTPRQSHASAPHGDTLVETDCERTSQSLLLAHLRAAASAMKCDWKEKQEYFQFHL